jgi:hypothetical protein
MLTRGSLRIRRLACAAAPVLRRGPRRGCPWAARCAAPPLARALGSATAGDSVTLPHASDAATRRRAAAVSRAGAGGQPHTAAAAVAAPVADSRDDRVATFVGAGLSEPVAAALRALGFAAPTAIQVRARGRPAAAGWCAC